MKFTKEKSQLLLFMLNRNKQVAIKKDAYRTDHPYEACMLMGIVIAELSDNDKMFSLPFLEQVMFIAKKTMPMHFELTNSLKEVLKDLEKDKT